MKNTFLKKIAALSCVVAVGMTMLAGCAKNDDKCIDGGEHSIIWQVTKEATCISEGSQTGHCPVCGYSVQEVIPVDNTAHDYGEWKITAPTESAAGEAVKTCSRDASHTLTVELPAYTLVDDGTYDEHIINSAPTATTEGSLTLMLEHEKGNIEFTVTVPRRELETLEDGITMAISLGNTLRASTGYYTEASGDDREGIGSKIPFNVYFGDDYVYVKELGNFTETWYSYDDEGKIFGITRQVDSTGAAISDPVRDESAIEDNMNGFSYQAGGGSRRVYGAEGVLENAYAGYILPEAVLKGAEEFYQAGDYFYLSFSYSRYENPYFVRYSVEAQLYASGAIKSLTQYTSIIHPYMIAEDEQGNKLFKENGDVIFAEIYEYDSNNNPIYEYDEDGNVVYLTDEDGNPVYATDSEGNVLIGKDGNPVRKKAGAYTNTYYSDTHEDVNNRSIVFEEQTLKSPDDEVIPNQYPSTSLYISSFDVSYQGTVIGDEPVEVPSNSPVIFSFSNILPATANLDNDPLSLYLRTATRDIELTMEYTDNEYAVTGFFNKTTRQATVNARYAGDVTIVFKTKGGLAEKAITLSFQKSAPTGASGEYPLIAQVNTYQESNGNVSYDWIDYSTSKTFTVYANQSFDVRATVSDAGKAFIDTSFKVFEIYDATALVDASANFTTESNSDGTMTFTCTKAGSYGVTLVSTRNSLARVTFLVTVQQQPSVSQMLINGTTYEGTLQYVNVDGTRPQRADISVVISNENNWMSGKINVTIGDNTAVYSYEYDSATGKLTSGYLSGNHGDTFDFSFSINEAYRLTVTHSAGFGDLTETIVLDPAE